MIVQVNLVLPVSYLLLQSISTRGTQVFSSSSPSLSPPPITNYPTLSLSLIDTHAHTDALLFMHTSPCHLHGKQRYS